MLMRANHSAGGSEGDTGTLFQRLRRFSGRAWWLHAVLIAQMILLPCPQPARGVWIEVDTDGDGIVDSGYDDGTPEPTEDPSQSWTPDPVYDSDGDGLDDANESAFGTDPYNPDSDYDGLSDADEVHLSGTNPLLPDSNDNGISDYNEYYGNYTVDTGGSTTPYDWDGDGIEDPVDPDPWSPENQPDSDGDYVPDNEDSHPYESWLWSDWNGNGVNDDAESQESDSDGDGISDSTDSHPWDVSLYNDWNGNGENDENEDWDGDGVGNLQDSHPNSNSLWCDWNGNGVNDDAEAGLMDQDGDGHNDTEDSHPFNAALYNDWNGDGIDDHNQTPPDPSQGPTDSDYDGHADESDSHPWDSLLWNDWNGNSMNDDQENWSSDSDADGYADISDTHPNDSSLWSDYNQNGINDEYELPSETPEEPEPIPEEPPYDVYSDTDADGITDFHDTHPSDSSRWSDYDDNGINDDQEILLMDRDGDGYADHVDSHPDDMELWNDHNGDGINDQHQAPPDSDNDGLPDHLDEFPEDYDNDGLSDTEELLWGTDYALADTEGDGLSDGEEVYAGTDPLNVDTDGDGLSDLEELRTHFTNPLEPTTLMVDEPPPPPEYEEGVPTEGEEPEGNDMPTPEEEPGDPTPPVLKVDWLQGGTEGSIQLVSGTYLSFPGSRVYTSTSDPLYGSEFNRSIVIKNTGGTSFTDLVLTCVGADSNRFTTSSVTNSLAAGASATFTVSLTSPSVDKAATLEISATELSSPFLIHLVSVGGIWTHNAADGTGMRRYLFANLTDTDKDGIPDKVEQLYAPLVVTPDGDLDGDGITNLTQYFDGRSLTSSGSNTDYDGDGLSNTEEDAWARAYPGSLNKFSFADAYADPDGDGLMTIEELDGTWGGAKDPHAVATHPFVKSSAPPVTTTSTGVTAGTYRTSSRKPPPQSTLASHSAHISRRSTQYAAWFDDGMLRKASHEAADANKGRVPSDFYNRVHITPPPTPPSPLRVADVGTDHLPNGYVQWLTQSFGGMLLPGFPTPSATDQVSQLRLGMSSDMDSDALPDVWEAFYQRASKAACPITWRDPGDSTPELARIALTLRTTALQERISANALRLQDAGITSTATNALTLENVRLEAEIAAISQVYGSLNPEGSNWESLAHTPADGASVTVKLVPVYSLKAPKFPAALAATPATTLASRRSTWITKHAEALYWQALQKLDPDHDGLSNSDERLLGHNPNLTDFTPTAGQRDTDEDGFSDEIELAVGSNHLNASYKPKFAVVVHAEPADLSATCLQPLSKAIPIQTVLIGPGGGQWPLGHQDVTATVANHRTLLAWQLDGQEPQWQPKSTPSTVTDVEGRAWLHVNSSIIGNLTVTFSAVPNYESANLTVDTVTCPLTVRAQIGDSDADGMPDDWETKVATDGLPAHDLNEENALDSELSPLHFGYHPLTSLASLPVQAQELLAELTTTVEDLGYLPEYPVTTLSYTYLAAPTTETAVATARKKILALIDPDHDGWSNHVEFMQGTNPRIPDNPATSSRDTDGDGVPDVLEFADGTNPKDAGSVSVQNLTDASLRVVWGNGQIASPGSLAPQTVEVQLTRSAGVLLKMVALEATCNGAYFALPAAPGKSVVWQSGALRLVTNAKGKAVFHFWTPADASPQWQIRIGSIVNTAIEALALVKSTGEADTGGGWGGGPGSSDRRPELGENPGFENSHAPFVIRFQDWKGGSLSYRLENDAPSTDAPQPYKASIQNKKWVKEFGVMMIANAGPVEERSIGQQTSQTAEAWKEANTKPPVPYIVNEYNKEWFDSGNGDGSGHGWAFIEQYEEDSTTTVRHFVQRIDVTNWTSEAQYHAYLLPSPVYLAPNPNLWEVVERVYPGSETPGGGDPGDPQENHVKHDYRQLAPRTFSYATQIDTTEEDAGDDPVARLNSLGAVIPIAEKRLPNGANDGWNGVVAKSEVTLNKAILEGGRSGFVGSLTRGKIAIAWDTEYPVSLSEKSRDAWLNRFFVVKTERSKPSGVTEASVNTSFMRLSDLLSTTALESDPLELEPGYPMEGVEKSVEVIILPVELAPEVLRVNTDFDEGKLVEGYAVPDSKETNPSQPSLRAERNSLDGRFKAGELITDDLHQGFFGLRPGSMPADFFDGAEVLIAKHDKTDEDTGRPESGVVRLHATKGQGTSAQQWNIPIGGPDTGAPQNLVPLLYSSSPQIPRDDVTYWIEGVTGGRITLEFFYRKGSAEFSHKQEFLVCTQQTKAQWRQEIVDQIKLQTSGDEDLSAFVPTNEFISNVPHLKAVYGFYEQLFVEKPEKLMWAGMAKLAGATVFAGLSDAQHMRESWVLGIPAYLANARDFQSQLMTGNRVIFDDLGWQHRAFVASGVYALKHVNAKDPAVSTLPVNIDAWDQIEEGISPGRDPALIKNGSIELLRREQQFIIQPIYDAIKLIDIRLTDIGYEGVLSVLAENPIPGGLAFSDLVAGSLAVFEDRWSWIDGSSEGMFQIWVGDSHKGLNAASRLWHVKTNLTNRAKSYAHFPDSVP